MNELTFFLGGSSPDGFRSHFSEIVNDTDIHTYIIKGGPGTGKSTLMKKLSAEFDEDKEIFLCSSDPSSYDAVFLKEHKTVIVDGTAPHVFEPECVGAVQEIINLGESWNSKMLRENKKEILLAQEGYLRHHTRCRRYISAAASVLEDNFRIGSDSLDLRKINSFISRLARKTLTKKSGCNGKISFRQMSAIGPEGYKTIIPEKDTLYLLNDSNLAAADYFLRNFAETVRANGLEATVSECNIMKNSCFEHMRVPELEISFITSTPVNRITIENKRSINLNRFYSKEAVASRKNRIKFNSTAASELLCEAAGCLKSAKSAHDRLEEHYIKAVDFKKNEAVLGELISMIKG